MGSTRVWTVLFLDPVFSRCPALKITLKFVALMLCSLFFLVLHEVLFFLRSWRWLGFSVNGVLFFFWGVQPFPPPFSFFFGPFGLRGGDGLRPPPSFLPFSFFLSSKAPFWLVCFFTFSQAPPLFPVFLGPIWSLPCALSPLLLFTPFPPFFQKNSKLCVAFPILTFLWSEKSVFPPSRLYAPSTLVSSIFHFDFFFFFHTLGW